MVTFIFRLFILLLCTGLGFAVSQISDESLGSGWWALIGFGCGVVLVALQVMFKHNMSKGFSSVNFILLRVFILVLCTSAGFAIGQVNEDWLSAGRWWAVIGFGFGGILIAIEEMLEGFSLRTFSSVTFGLLLGSFVALMIDYFLLFNADEKIAWLVKLGLFICFGYIGMVLAIRSNKEDFSIIIPFVRFSPQNKPDNLLLLDTSVIIDGRIADLVESKFLEGIIVVPRFVLKELQHIADSNDPIIRARGRRGLDMLSRIQRNQENEVKIHEGDIPEEEEVDSKLVLLTRALGGKLYTNDYNLAKVAELQSVPFININELANALKKVIIPGEVLSLKIVREGKDKGQGIGYLNDGTMVVVNHSEKFIGTQVTVRVISLLQTGAGVIVFSELKEQ